MARPAARVAQAGGRAEKVFFQGRLRGTAAGQHKGKLMGALALTHKAAYREPFEPLPAGVVHLPADFTRPAGQVLASSLGGKAAPIRLEFLEPGGARSGRRAGG